MNSNTLTDETFAALSTLIQQRIGLSYAPEKRTDLQKGLLAAALETGTGDLHAFARQLLAQAVSPEQCKLLAKHLTIGETYFFREPGTFELFISLLRPMIEKYRAADKALKIWSAGCCTGEEIYSLAILLHQAIPDLSSWNLSLIGTDINQAFLAKAIRGQFPEWSFRSDIGELRNNYFTRAKDGTYQISDIIRDRIKFFPHNLFEYSYPSPINGLQNVDVICCRNVLLYFSDEGRKQVIENFHACLAESGFLLVGLTELSYIPDTLFEQIHDGSNFLYRKRGRRNSGQRRPAKNQPLKDSVPDKEIVPAAARPGSKASGVAGENTPEPPALTESFSAILEMLTFAQENELFEKQDKLLRQLLQNKPLFESGSPGEQERVYVLAGDHFLRSGAFTEAKALLEEALSTIKLNSGLYLQYGKALQELALHEAALTAYKKCLFLDQDNSSAHYLSALACRALDRAEDYRRYMTSTSKLLQTVPDGTLIPYCTPPEAGAIRQIALEASQEGDE
jgi:chemotaxis protein methyltransferase CheR